MLNFKLQLLASLSLTLAATVNAQSPAGFVPVVKNSLVISYGTNNVEPAGELIPRPETASPPTISTSDWGTTKKGIIFMIDLDVPRNNSRMTLLHWLAPGVTLAPGSASQLQIPQAPPGAPYQMPSPPVGDIPHRYTFVLFAEPENFQIPDQFAKINPPASSGDRVGFNLTAFIEAAKLGSPLAANFITVQNTTGTATTTFPPPSPTGTGSSTMPSLTGNRTTPLVPVATAEATIASEGALWKAVIAVGSCALGLAMLML